MDPQDRSTKGSAADRFHRQAVQVTDAQRLIEACVRTLDSESVPLDDALGRHLAADIFADAPLPHFRRSGMDGFAVRAADLAGASPEAPVRLEVIDSIPCGSTPSKPVRTGTASRIMTGAMVPDGADAVIMLEMTQASTEAQGTAFITVIRSVPAGTNLSEIGSELPAGAPLLEKGRRIRAGETALLAAFGYADVPVYRKPRAAVIATGSELLDIHEPLQPGKIRNSNLSMLAALVREAGGEPIPFGKVPDDREHAIRIIDEAFRQADLVITSGGVSVGDYDILTDIFETWDGKVLFNKVAMRPGSPTTVGLRDDKFLFALSGNPSACFVGFQLFARPLLLGMQGADGKFLAEGTAFLAEDYRKVNAYTRYVRGKLTLEQGRMLASRSGQDQSGVISSIKDADCLMVIPPGGSGKAAGELITVLMLL